MTVTIQTIDPRTQTVYRALPAGGGPGTVILVDDLNTVLSDPDVTVALTEGVAVELTPSGLTVELAEAAFSVTLDTGYSVTLTEPDLEVDLG